MDYDLGTLAALVRRHAPKALQLKFVVTFDAAGPRAGDLGQAARLLLALPAKVRQTPVFLIPEAFAPAPYLDRCRALERSAEALLAGPLQGFDVRVQPQWHRVLYGDQRGR
jgi:hypothetical protein